MKEKVFILFLFLTLLSAEPVQKERVELVSYSVFLIPVENTLECFNKLPILKIPSSFAFFFCSEDVDYYPIKFERVKESYNLISTWRLDNWVKNFTVDQSDLKKVIFFEYYGDQTMAVSLPKEKKVLFKWEAAKWPISAYDPYSVVYTFDDDLVDNVKFFKFCYPSFLPMLSEVPTFEEKKFCTMVVGNWIPERVQMVTFFATKPAGEFDFYGAKIRDKEDLNYMYKGKILGYYSGKKKLATLKNYRFCICFENSHTTKGYITEKIFNCFAAGCVPIYWGPDNVETYIPQNCFIDYRNFSNNEELYQYLKTMSKDTYEKYIENIRLFLKSKKSELFSPEQFEKVFCEAINR